MKLGINGKTAFIAGSSQGIGRAVAEALATEGCSIVLCARNEAPLLAARDAIHHAHQVPVHAIAADLDTRSDVEHVIARVSEVVGGVDILVTNTGGPPAGCLDELDEEAFALGWNRTLMTTVRLTRGFLPWMRGQGFGRIITITSITVRQPTPRLLLSNTYRAAVTGFAKTLAAEEAAHGITVNNIAPGYIGTARLEELIADRAAAHGRSIGQETAAMLENVPLGRTGLPEEVGAMAAFLASQHAAYITGSTILVDGGLHKGLA